MILALIFITYIYIKGSLSFPIWEGSYPYRSSGLINPTISSLFFSVGLIHTILTFQATWREEERRIGRLIERWASIT